MDKDWLTRVEPQEDKPLLVKGFLYEYASRGKKNIGLQALAAYNTPEGRKKKDGKDQI